MQSPGLAATQVLGTFITEWDAGKDICCQAFASEAAAEQCAAQLTAIALHCGFDGWLINVENAVPLDGIPHMLAFLRFAAVQCVAFSESAASSLMRSHACTLVGAGRAMGNIYHIMPINDGQCLRAGT